MNRRRDAVPWILGALVVVVFVADYASASMALLPFLVVPVIIAAGFASPRATTVLAIVTVALGLGAGRVAYSFSDLNFWFYLAADTVICGVAIILAIRRRANEEARLRAQRQAVAIEEDFHFALESSAIGVAMIDLNGRIYSANPALAHLTGRSREWLEQHEVADLLADESSAARARVRAELLKHPHTSLTREHRLLLADGREGWVRESMAVMRDGDGRPRGYVTQFEDITQERSEWSSLQQQARRDPLTGLLNRGALLHELEPIVGRDRRRGDGLCVLFVDLDGLKPVNDRRGHTAGDQLIVETARRIEHTVRSDDLVARVGGDEYVIVLREVTAVEQAAGIAEKVRAAIAQPVVIDGDPVDSAASLGCALDEPGLSAADLLDRADRALYRAKRDGGNRVRCFDPALDRLDVPIPERPRT